MGLFRPDSDQRRYVKKVCLIISIVAVGFAMVWARAFYGSMQAYEQGVRHLEACQNIRAITFFDRSIHWYTPLNPYVRRSAERLWEMANWAHQQGDTKLALTAIRTIRNGFYSARSVYTPGKDWINRCDVRIGELIAMRSSTRTPRVSDGASESSVSLKDTSLNTFWDIVVEIGFLGWVGSALGFIMFAFRDNRKAMVRASPALKWASLALILFAFWIIGMVMA